MKFLVVDAVPETRDKYRELVLNAVPNVEIFDALSAEDALFQFVDKQADIIISSEMLIFRNGFELTRIIKKLKSDVPVILIADDDKHAIDAIKSEVFDYLVAPSSVNQIVDSVNKAVAFINQKLDKKPNDNTLQIKLKVGLNNGYKLIDFNELAYCIADGAYTKIFYTNGDTDLSGFYLGKIEQKLLSFNFMRINRSVIVNMKFIRHIDKRKELCQIEVAGNILSFKMTRTNIHKMQIENIL
ncbi:MAG TPA: LytTR family DNA-binding domain-containing protein [Prolixibacteraceae bacterium]|nr:LytTR family DNA-binding domain-containing protein [Prolixibacteraceae bacterium]